MNKIVLRDVTSIETTWRDPFLRLLYGMGLVEYSKKEHPLLVEIMNIFRKNTKTPLSYDDIISKVTPHLTPERSHVVKVCKKLSSLNILEETSYTPENKKRWERRYYFTNFKRAIQTLRRESEALIESLDELRSEVEK
jgi:hypothetical protein